MSSMAKSATLFLLISLVLSATSAHAARPLPAETPSSVEGFDGEDLDLSCNNLGEEECLMRKTLEAHIDYIYTQKKPND